MNNILNFKLFEMSFQKLFMLSKLHNCAIFEDCKAWRLCSCTMQKAEFPGYCEVVTVKVETLSAPFVLPFPVLFLLHKYTVHIADDSYESIKKVTNASQFLTSST